MRPEPDRDTPRTKRVRYNETRPLTIRTGSIRDELDARSDGTEKGYRAVVVRDLKRYYEILANDLAGYDFTLEQAKVMYSGDPSLSISIIDALERAHVLVQHAGLTIDEALVSVGLVKKEEK